MERIVFVVPNSDLKKKIEECEKKIAIEINEIQKLSGLLNQGLKLDVIRLRYSNASYPEQVWNLEYYINK